VINLAGRPDCDRYIREELARARIKIVDNGAPAKEEVPAQLTGRLGPFTFRRAWYYWMVDGPVPIKMARVLWKDPEGAVSVRVAGYAGGIDPDVWTKGRRPKRVDTYHIDDQAGLRLFADTIKAHGLDKAGAK